MTDAELITDDIVKDFIRYMKILRYKITPQHAKAGIAFIQDDIVRPYRNVFMGWKRDAIAYEKALKEIRDTIIADSHMIADRALKGEYHEKEI